MVNSVHTHEPGAPARRAPADEPELARLREAVAEVPDPELPVVTIAELGILREVRRDHQGILEAVITPTYTGCPAIEAIAEAVHRVLAEHGAPAARVRTELAPAWTTDWITDEGRRKLAEHGVAPPGGPAAGPVDVALTVRCPHCHSTATRLLSRFGSTPCQSLRVCATCGEPFGHVRPV